MRSRKINVPFQIPSLEILQSTPLLLEKNSAIDDAQYYSYVELLKKVIEQIQKESDLEKIKSILVGAHLFEIEMVRSQYSYFSKPKHTVDQTLEKQLGIGPQHILSNDEWLTYLSDFYFFVKEKMNETDFKSLHEALFNKKKMKLIWDQKNAFMAEVHFALKQVINRHAQYISKLVHGVPDLIALRKNIADLRSHYNKARESRYFSKQNTDRDRKFDVIDFLNKALFVFYPEKFPSKYTYLQAEEADIRKAILFDVLLDIQDDYKILSPKGGWITNGSEFYKISLRALNVEDISEIDGIQKVRGLQALLSYIERVRRYWATERKQMSETLSDDLEKYYSTVTKRFCYEESQLKESSYLRRGVIALASYSLTQFLKKNVFRGTVIGIGTLVGGVSGGAVGLAAGVLLHSGITSEVAAYLLTYAFEKMGDMTVDQAQEIVSRFKQHQENGEPFWHALKPDEQPVFVKFINTLLKLPADLISDEEKARIRNILGLDERKFLELGPNHKEKSNGNQVIEIRDDNREIIQTNVPQPEMQPQPRISSLHSGMFYNTTPLNASSPMEIKSDYQHNDCLDEWENMKFQ